MMIDTPVLPPVKVVDLLRTFGSNENQVRAVDGISFEMSPGEHLAIMGPSGSGKSTLLHLLAGIDSPTSGHVFIGGQRIDNMPDKALTLFRRKHIGMIFQAYNLIPTLNVEDNLRLPLLLDGGDNDQNAKIDSMLTSLGLTDRRTHRPDQLSGGEQQRVAIGRAMISEPTVMLADEPTGNLDSANSRKLCEFMHETCRKFSRTLVTVTHDPGVAIWSDRVMILRDGRIVGTIVTKDCPSAKELSLTFQDMVAAR